MAPTTLLTVLSRLADKGFLRIEKTGRSAEYRPLVAREDYLARQGRKFYDTLCGGSLPAFAAALCASGLTAEELEELGAIAREGKRVKVLERDALIGIVKKIRNCE